MTRTRSSSALLLLLLAVLGFPLLFSDGPSLTANAEILQADSGLRWYRGNMHTHSHWSDGDDYLESIAVWYRDHGYDFLCFTDHNVLANTERWVEVEKSKGGQKAYDKLKQLFPDWVDERTTAEGKLEVRLKRFDEVKEKIAEPGKFLLIQGEEISDRAEDRPIHLNASNVQELIPPIGGSTVLEAMQNNVNAVIAQRERTGEPILVHLNHPNFHYAITAEELMRVVGENFFEVYNGHPTVHNSGDHHHASTDRMWDIINTLRIAELKLPLMYGMGVDDGHSYHDIPHSGSSNPGRGWVVVLAKELAPNAIIDAMEAGRFYASSGVALEQVASSPAGLEVNVDAEEGVTYTIEFIGTRSDFDSKSEEVVDDEGKPVRTTRRYSSDIGETLKVVEGATASYRFSGDELYVRARITSSKKHPNPSEPDEPERAWTQPTLGPAAPK